MKAMMALSRRPKLELTREQKSDTHRAGAMGAANWGLGTASVMVIPAMAFSYISLETSMAFGAGAILSGALGLGSLGFVRLSHWLSERRRQRELDGKLLLPPGRTRSYERWLVRRAEEDMGTICGSNSSHSALDRGPSGDFHGCGRDSRDHIY